MVTIKYLGREKLEALGVPANEIPEDTDFKFSEEELQDSNQEAVVERMVEETFQDLEEEEIQAIIDFVNSYLRELRKTNLTENLQGDLESVGLKSDVLKAVLRQKIGGKGGAFKRVVQKLKSDKLKISYNDYKN